MKRIFDIQQTLKKCIFMYIIISFKGQNYIHESSPHDLMVSTRVDQVQFLHHICLSWSSCNVLSLASMPKQWY
jgi:hypothetical protein